MKITNIGQAGLLIETKDLTVMVDPYFTDSVGVVEPKKHRRVPMQESLWQVRPDVLIFTHDHLDHHDPETAERILKTHKKITVLCPGSVWQKVRQNGGDHNYVRFHRHSQWTQGHIRFTAVKAEHSDVHPIGVIIEAEDKVLYITGDTLYNTEIFADLPAHIDAVFLPVNGVGNNMNMTDAKRFCQQINAKKAVPMHCGLFDNIDMAEFDYEPKVVPTIYQEVTL